MRLWAGLRQNTAPRQKSPRARATVYAESAGNRTTTPRRKAGSFYDRADGSGSGRAAEQTAGSTGTAGGAAPGSAQAGGCGSGICRRLGRSVRCTDAFWSGLCAGLCRGLLRCGSRWGRTGGAGPEFRNADRGERLPALRTGCGGSGTVALARPIRPGGDGWLRHTGGKRSLLRGGGGKRRSDHPVLRRRRPAGRGCWGWRCGASRPKNRAWAA